MSLAGLCFEFLVSVACAILGGFRTFRRKEIVCPRSRSLVGLGGMVSLAPSLYRYEVSCIPLPIPLCHDELMPLKP